jgi:DNA-binding PadR family transcriptional regulator
MSAVKLLVLGAIVRRGAAHGYAVHQDLAAWRAETWTSIKRGSIYHALEKLESQGMIQAAETGNEEKLGPARTEYTLTEEGRKQFIALLEEALGSNDFQQLAAGIAFMELLPRDHVVSLLQARLSTLRQTVSFLQTLPTEPVPSDPSKHPELVGMWVGYMEYVTSTTQHLIRSIQSGKYVFQGETKDKEDSNSW